MILRRWKTINGFATSFFISNHACCKFVAFKENDFSNTFFKIITVIRPSALFMGDQDLQLREGLGKTSNLSTKKLIATPFLLAPPHPFLDCRPHISKKYPH